MHKCCTRCKRKGSWLEREITISLGVVVERRKIDHPWADYSWKPTSVIPGAGPVEEWKQIAAGEDYVWYHAATLPLTLYRSDTEAYLVNLADAVPSVYVILRQADTASPDDQAYYVFDVTASPYEAQDYLDPAADIVEPVPMPPALIAWVEEFINAHHVEVPFLKRPRRDGKGQEAEKFGKEPIFERSRRSMDADSDEFQG